MGKRRIFKIIFHNQGQVYEIYAKGVNQGPLLGFVEVAEIVFGERSQVVVDPGEESLKTEFQGVRRTFLPLHSVVRIDEVEKEGVSRISAAPKGEGTLSPFPAAIYTKPDPGKN